VDKILDNITIPATNRTPEVAFNFDTGQLKVVGESYPEDVASFYSPLFDALDAWLASHEEQSCLFELRLIYFNSSSAKAIMMLMEKLDEAAEKGMEVSVHWYHDPEDDTMLELGEEFGEDLEHATFEMVAQEST
jgi:hypothetical protein